MNDINEIYEPLYRETSKLPLIILLSVALFLSGFVAFFILRKIKGKFKTITPQQEYNNTIETFTNIQKEIDNKSSYNFSVETSFAYKNYLSKLYNNNLVAATGEELFSTINDTTNIGELYINRIEPTLYGKRELSTVDKNNILREFVESITMHYNTMVKVDD